MNDYKALAGQTLIYGLGSVVPRILNYILLTPFYTRIFTSQSDYGVHSYLYAISAFILVILTFGIETTFFRYAQKDDYKKVYSTAYIFLLANSILFIFFTYFFYDTINQWLDIQNKRYVFWFLGIIITDVISTIPLADLRLKNLAKKFAILRISNVVINIVLNFIFLLLLPKFNLSFFKNFDLVEYTFISNFLANGITLIFLIFPIRFSKRDFDYSIFKKMVSYSYPIMISGILGMINEVADKVFLKFLLPKDIDSFKEIGIYTANYKIAALITIYNTMFRYAFEPFLFKISGNLNNKEKYANITMIYFLSVSIIYVLIICFIDYVKLFIGSSYHEGLKIVPIVLMANIFFGLYYTMSVWYKINDKTYFAIIFSLVGAIITMVLNIILIPIIGYFGAAVATLVCYFMMFVLTAYFNQKYYPIEYKFYRMIEIFLSLIGITIFLNGFSFDSIYLNFALRTIIALLFIFYLYKRNYDITKNLLKNDRD